MLAVCYFGALLVGVLYELNLDQITRSSNIGKYKLLINNHFGVVSTSPHIIQCKPGVVKK